MAGTSRLPATCCQQLDCRHNPIPPLHPKSPPGFLCHKYYFCKDAAPPQSYVARRVVNNRTSIDWSTSSGGRAGKLQDVEPAWKAKQKVVNDTWTARVVEHAKRGQFRQALQVYEEEIKDDEVLHTSYTFVALLKPSCCCTSTTGGSDKHQEQQQQQQQEDYVKRVHSEAAKYCLDTDVHVGTVLVTAYAKCGNLDAARRLFEAMPCRNVVTWTAMMWAYAGAEQGGAAAALQLYARMAQESPAVAPNARTFVCALKAACAAASLEQVRAVHADARQRGVETDVYVATMLVDVYAKLGCLGDARAVFESMPSRSVVSWTALIVGYAAADQGDGPEEALRLYARMQREGAVAPNDHTYVGALKACCSLAAGTGGSGTERRRWVLEQVRGIHRHLTAAEAARPSSCSSSTAAAVGDLNPYVGSTLVDAYAKCGNLVEARRVFDAMPERSRGVVAWNAMIHGYAHSDDAGGAVRLFLGDMRAAGVAPDAVTFLGALKACGSVMALDAGRAVHAQVEAARAAGAAVLPGAVATAVIDMYGKCGSTADAQHAFDELFIATTSPSSGRCPADPPLPPPPVSAWNALMAGYARAGATDTVFRTLDRMRRAGVAPTGVTALCVLSACRHAGLVDAGTRHFANLLRGDFGGADCVAGVEHYTCVVDMLGRAGRVADAVAVARGMPFGTTTRDDALAVWETVLGACRKWGEVGLGRQAFAHAVAIDGASAGAYVVMANIFADAGMWEDVRRVQALRAAAPPGAMWKPPGQSAWTDAGGGVHVCTAVGGGGSRDHREASAMLVHDFQAKLVAAR